MHFVNSSFQALYDQSKHTDFNLHALPKVPKFHACKRPQSQRQEGNFETCRQCNPFTSILLPNGQISEVAQPANRIQL